MDIRRWQHDKAFRISTWNMRSPSLSLHPVNSMWRTSHSCKCRPAQAVRGRISSPALRTKAASHVDIACHEIAQQDPFSAQFVARSFADRDDLTHKLMSRNSGIFWIRQGTRTGRGKFKHSSSHITWTQAYHKGFYLNIPSSLFACVPVQDIVRGRNRPYPRPPLFVKKQGIGCLGKLFSFPKFNHVCLVLMVIAARILLRFSFASFLSLPD